MFQHIVTANWQINRGCSHMLEHAKPYLIQLQPSSWLFNLVSSFPDNMFTSTMLIYHNVIQVCSFIKQRTVKPTCMNKPVNNTFSSWPALPCSTGKNKLCIFMSVVGKYGYLHVDTFVS